MRHRRGVRTQHLHVCEVPRRHHVECFRHHQPWKRGLFSFTKRDGVVVDVEVLLYVHTNRRFIRDVHLDFHTAPDLSSTRRRSVHCRPEPLVLSACKAGSNQFHYSSPTNTIPKKKKQVVQKKQDILRTARLFFHWFLCLEPSPFLYASC